MIYHKLQKLQIKNCVLPSRLHYLFKKLGHNEEVRLDLLFLPNQIWQILRFCFTSEVKGQNHLSFIFLDPIHNNCNEIRTYLADYIHVQLFSENNLRYTSNLISLTVLKKMGKSNWSSFVLIQLSHERKEHKSIAKRKNYLNSVWLDAQNSTSLRRQSQRKNRRRHCWLRWTSNPMNSNQNAIKFNQQSKSNKKKFSHENLKYRKMWVSR